MNKEIISKEDLANEDNINNILIVYKSNIVRRVNDFMLENEMNLMEACKVGRLDYHNMLLSFKHWKVDNGIRKFHKLYIDKGNHKKWKQIMENQEKE